MVNDGCKLNTMQITEEKLMYFLNKIKEDKAGGPDGLAPRLLFNVRHSLVKPLLIVFRKTLEEGVITEN